MLGNGLKGTVPFSLIRKSGQSPKNGLYVGPKGDSPIFVDTKIGTVPDIAHSIEPNIAHLASEYKTYIIGKLWDLRPLAAKTAKVPSLHRG
jgi:hypothetical protein